MVRLCEVELSQIHGFLDSQVSGINMNVGIKIFNIVGGLGFVRNHCHSCLRFLLGVPGLHLLRMQRILVG